MPDKTLPPSESGHLLDDYDRQLSTLHGLPDVSRQGPSTVNAKPPFAIGRWQTVVIRTYRQREQGDTLFLEVVRGTEAIRLVLPPQVTERIARQREALTAKSRSKAAKATAEDRAARGLKPGFLRKEETR